MHSPLWMLLHCCCQALSTFLTCFVVVPRVRPLEIHARRLQNRPQRLQNRPSEAPKSSQDRPRGSRSGPRASQERPRASDSAARAPQEHPKSAPRAPKSAPRAPQERPRAPQEPLKSAKRRPRDPSGGHFEGSKLEKATFEHDASRNSFETCVWNDFRSTSVWCAQVRTCEKPIKTLCFSRFFRCRLFFERVGPLDRKSIEKPGKSTL